MFYYILMLKISYIFIKEKNLIKNKYKDYKKFFIHKIQLYLEENLKQLKKKKIL